MAETHPRTVQVDYLMDDVMFKEAFTGASVIAKIHKDGRGYVLVDGVRVMYRRVERIRIEAADV